MLVGLGVLPSTDEETQQVELSLKDYALFLVLGALEEPNPKYLLAHQDCQQLIIITS